MTALSLLVLIPIVGLAIDAGYAFVIKARLSAAMDSAALAAGRGLNLGSTIADAQTQATTAATNFFNANFRPGYMNTDPTPANRPLTPTFTVGKDNSGNPNGVLTIAITGSVIAPTYFMKWLGFNNLTIGATGTATRKNLVMEIVLDKSASMGSRSTAAGTIPTSIDSTSQSCEAMVYSTIQFINYFSPYDNVGEMSFNYTVFDDYALSTSFKNSGASGVSNSIANITCGNNTNTTAALYKAYQNIKAKNQPLAQNVIVLFTDGVPNGVNASFPIRTQVDSRAGIAGSSPNPPDVPAGNNSNCLNSRTTICQNMPVCTTTAGFVTGVITQTANFSYAGGDRGAVYKMFSTDSTPTVPAGCPSSGTALTSQTIAYIPDTDFFNNSTHGDWDGWLYKVNSHTAPASTPITNGNNGTKFLGDLWTNYPTTGLGADSNFFPTGPYAGKFRPDLPNTIGVASMNSATDMAATIRADATYHITIDTVYLQGNGQDPVDRSFLQIVTNQQTIQPVIYDPTAPSYPNPHYQDTQQQGIWAATTSTLQLQAMFQQIASSLLRISQ